MSELAQGFSDGYSINGSKRHGIKYKGFISVLVLSIHGLLLGEPIIHR